MSRTDQERVTVSLNGQDLGIWDMFTGGAAKAESTKHRPGGMGEEESLGGPRSRDDFVLQRLYKLERDHPQAKLLDEAVGRGKIRATRTMLTVDREAVPGPLTFTGTLIGLVHPDHDSSASDKKMIQLEVSADGPIS